MNRTASLILPILITLFIITLIGCAGMPSGSDKQASADLSSQAGSSDIPAAADPDYDPAVNLLVHKGWSLSMPPGWRATVDHSGKGSYLFRLSHDLVRISVQPIHFNFDIDRSKLTAYMEDRLSRGGVVLRNEAVESLPLSRDCRLSAWDVERDAGGLHRVILEENERGLFEWRITISKRRQVLYQDAVMRMFREAELLENMDISRRVQESDYEFSSQGGIWRWYGDLDQGFLLESLIAENDPYTFLTVTSYKSLKDANYKTEDWISVNKKKSAEVRTIDISFSGRPEKTKLWIQDEPGHSKEVLFFYGKENPVMFYLDMRNREGQDRNVNTFLEGDAFRNLLNFNLKLPEAKS